MESLFTGDVFYSAPLRQKKSRRTQPFPKASSAQLLHTVFFFFCINNGPNNVFCFLFFLRFCLRWHTSLTFSQSYPQFTALTANETKQSRESKVLKPNIKHRKKMKRGQARSHKGTKQGHRRGKKRKKKEMKSEVKTPTLFPRDQWTNETLGCTEERVEKTDNDRKWKIKHDTQGCSLQNKTWPDSVKWTNINSWFAVSSCCCIN